MYSNTFRVVFVPYSERHFIKNFSKKYKGKWDTTRKALDAQFARIESLMNNGRTSPPIKSTPDNMHLLIKHDFAIAGMHQSPHGSGNRAIIHVDKIKHTVYVLLVYHKTDLADGNETAQWQRLVKDGCGEYIAVFDLPSL